MILRQRLFTASMWMCLGHLFAYFVIAKDNVWRNEMLGVYALVIAFAIGLLWQTKQTLPQEQGMPAWLYPFSTVAWALSGIAWLLGYFNVAT